MINDFTKKEAPVLSTLGLGGGNASRLILSSGGGGDVTSATAVATRSLRFNAGDQAYLNRTPSSAGDVDKWTWSGWIKRSALGAHTDFFSAVQNGQNATIIQFDNNDRLDFENFVGNSDKGRKITTRLFRDVSAWYHIVCSYDSGNATADDRVKLYVNGVRETDFNYSTNPSSGQDSIVNSTNAHHIGSDTGFNNNYFNGMLADVYLVDGSVLDASSFGSFDSNGVWQNSLYDGSLGTNGFHLDFADNSSSSAIGQDKSGNSNDFTVNNFNFSAGADNDSLFDNPKNGSQSDTGAGGQVSGNYATWSPLVAQLSTGTTISDGGLKTTCSGTRSTTMSTFPLKGKTYWEVTFGSGTYNYIGIC